MLEFLTTLVYSTEKRNLIITRTQNILFDFFLNKYFCVKLVFMKNPGLTALETYDFLFIFRVDTVQAAGV